MIMLDLKHGSITEINKGELLEQITSCLSPESFAECAKCLIGDLEKRDIEATLEEVVEAVNLGLEKGRLRVIVAAEQDSNGWKIFIGVPRKDS